MFQDLSRTTDPLRVLRHSDKPVPGLIQFRAELFDFLSRTNFRLPDRDISSPTFNHILESESPRQAQLALKFMY